MARAESGALWHNGRHYSTNDVPGERRVPSIGIRKETVPTGSVGTVASDHLGGRERLEIVFLVVFVVILQVIVVILEFVKSPV